MPQKPKIKTIFVCRECGYEQPKWLGKCPQCNTFNTFDEQIVEVAPKNSFSSASSPISSAVARPISDITAGEEVRFKTGMKELDRVLGGGIVKGSVVLLSGDPGIGKSTLLMHICGRFSDKQLLYVSGEESAKQLKMRADRLLIDQNGISLMNETDVISICDYIELNKPDMVMIDSIQTMNYSALSSSTGSVAQVRECTQALLRVGKRYDIPIIIVGHVNKDGAIAGPKVMEHIVDAVLYFEGERNYSYRILRAIKNRFGSTNEIGVFEMFEDGLQEVENPSMMLLSGRAENVSGSSIVCTMEGTRPILAEVQGLVTTTGFGNPRRMSTGFDFNRMSLILAVLEKRLGFYFSNLDAYLNIVGGLKLDEPAADLPVALALVSALKDRPISNIVTFGEIGLSGELRSVSRVRTRISECKRLGFTDFIIPYAAKRQLKDSDFDDANIILAKSLREAVAKMF